MRALRTAVKLATVAALSTLMLSAPAVAQGSGVTPPSREQARDRARDAGRQAVEGAAAQAQAKVGEKAPNFTLTDTEGKSHSLNDFAGKIVVLQWINPECPYCVRVMKDGQVKNAAKEVREMDKDVVWLLVNSTSHMPPKGSTDYLKEHELKFPALVDQAGVAGRMYGARTTPHMYVIDKEGILRYEGAIDDDPRGAKARADETVTNYVVNAIRQITTGETVSPANTRPWGCSVKYAAGS